MISRKLQFLQAVVGEDGARALSKAAERAVELDQAIFPRTILAWLDVHSSYGHEGVVPGIDSVPFQFKKTEKGFDGSIAVNGEMHCFRDASLDHVAGCVAVALELDHERISSQVRPEQIMKLGKSIDLLVKSQLVKTSWNAKMRRKYHFETGSDTPAPDRYGDPSPLDPDQAEARRIQYARSIGLDPLQSRGNVDGFPQSNGGNELPYDSNFPVEHETAHAMMTPPGKTVSQYQRELSATDKMPSEMYSDVGSKNPDRRNAALASPEYQAHALGTQQENIANHLEHHIDRRSGLNATRFQSRFRIPGTPLGNNDSDYPIWDKSGPRKIPSKVIRDEAKSYSQKFDEGARFTPEGEIAPPTGIDAKINARAKTKLPMVKTDVKPNKRIRLPGTAAAPRPPQGPTPPTLVQPNNVKQAAAGAAGTAQTMPLPQVSKKKPSIQVTKSESQKKCLHCTRTQFNQDAFKGCFCFSALAKNVKTILTKEGYTLEFGTAWDADAIATLVDTLKGK
jgi:hypothetical protein